MPLQYKKSLENNLLLLHIGHEQFYIKVSFTLISDF